MISMKHQGVTTIFAVAIATTAIAQSTETDYVRANLAADYAQCWSYYTITAEGARRGERADLARHYTELADQAFFLGSELSNPEATAATAEIAHAQQLDEMHRDFSNLAILYLKYHQLCTGLITDPASRAEYWRRGGQ